MLTCIVPSFVRDLRARDDKVASADAFAKATNVHAALTPRELQDVVKMLCDDETGLPRQDIEAAISAARQQRVDDGELIAAAAAALVRAHTGGRYSSRYHGRYSSRYSGSDSGAATGGEVDGGGSSAGGGSRAAESICRLQDGTPTL